MYHLQRSPVCVKMVPSSGSQIMRAVIATAALFIGIVSAKQNGPGLAVEYSFKTVPYIANGLYFPNVDVNFDTDKIDSNSLKDLASKNGLEGSPADWGRQGDIRDWLLVKSREHVEHKPVDGLADTPLGDISQQCYEDVMRFFTDFDATQKYALKSKFWRKGEETRGVK